MKNHIQLDGNIYEVRRVGDSREVFCEGRWITLIEFTDWLARNDQWRALSDLVAYGAKTLRELQ